MKIEISFEEIEWKFFILWNVENWENVSRLFKEEIEIRNELIQLKENSYNEAKELFDFIESQKEVSKWDVRKQRFVWQNKFSKRFKNIIPSLEEIALWNWYELIRFLKKAEWTNKPVEFYRLKKINN